MTKAISLFSGGLDSILAAKLIADQGVEVEALHFKTVFSANLSENTVYLPSGSILDKFGIKLKIIEIGQEYFEILKNPKYGYGSNINPCLDCRIFIFKKAREYMKETGADFIITGEVLGQRPMSQRREAIRTTERESGLDGYILRPLSAKLFEPTIAEKQGLISREKLLAIEGRSRKPQIKLAKDLGVNDYPSPAGGCLLTDPGFANRMKDLIKYAKDFNVNDVKLLKAGRHFRLDKDAKLIVGRNEKENNYLSNLAKDGDFYFSPSKVMGPVGIGRGVFNQEKISQSLGIVARYCDGKDDQKLDIDYKKLPSETTDSETVLPEKEAKLEVFRI